MYYLAIIKIAVRMCGKVILYANGIGPITKKKNKRRVEKIVKKVDAITLRDEESKQELINIGINSKAMIVTADPVLTIEPKSRPEIAGILEKYGVPADKPFAVVSVRNWKNEEQICEKLAVLCDYIYEKYDRNIVFLALQIPNDIEVCMYAKQHMQNTAYIVDGVYRADELMGIYGMADMAISMRLHGLIFATKAHIPMTGIIYDPKMDSYLKKMGIPAIGTAENFDHKTATDVIDGIFKKSDEIRKNVKSMCDEMQKATENNERELIRVLKGSEK